MTPRTALLSVLLWGITFTCVGSAIGATIGAITPGYYQALFRDGHSPAFKPIQVGIGLGATQGVVAGVTMSIAVLSLLMWRDTRSTRPATDGDSGGDSIVKNSGKRTWSVHLIWSLVTAMALLIVGAFTIILGAIVGQQHVYQNWTERKLDKLATILESNEFNGVEAGYSSAAQVYLTGTIRSPALRDSLRDKLITAFGTEEADEMIWRVDVSR